MALELKQSQNEGVLEGIRNNGVKYSVRADRRRYFFPEEWIRFSKLPRNKLHRFFYITLLHTGGRSMEVLNLQHKDIDLERGTITFNTVKQRKANKRFYVAGKSRSFFVASNFLKEYKSLIRNKKININDYIFLKNDKLPDNYKSLPNKEKKKYYNSQEASYYQMMRRNIKKIGVKDWYNFSLHNIRKTYGNWMRAFNLEMAELCYRMGHDMDTYLAHYGSSLIFTPDERRKIEKILGDIK